MCFLNLILYQRKPEIKGNWHGNTYVSTLTWIRPVMEDVLIERITGGRQSSYALIYSAPGVTGIFAVIPIVISRIIVDCPAIPIRGGSRLRIVLSDADASDINVLAILIVEYLDNSRQSIGSTEKNKFKQECIPVGCVPAAHWPYAWVCFGGVSLPGGASFLGEGASFLGGASFWGGGSPWQGVPLAGGSPWHGASLAGGSPWQGGLLLGGSPYGGCLLLGRVPPLPPVNRITYSCKNITLAATLLRLVKIKNLARSETW